MNFSRKRKGSHSELAKLKKEVSAKERIKFTFWMDAEDHRKIKAIAAMKGGDVTTILNEYIHTYVRQYRL